MRVTAPQTSAVATETTAVIDESNLTGSDQISIGLLTRLLNQTVNIHLDSVLEELEAQRRSSNTDTHTSR